MAPAASAVRKPFGAFACSSVTLSNVAAFPEMVRYATPEGLQWTGFAALAKKFGWKEFMLMQGDPKRYDATATYMGAKLLGAGYNVARDGPTTRPPEFDDCVNVMKNMKRKALRVIIVI